VTNNGCGDNSESHYDNGTLHGFLRTVFNPLNADFNPICHFLALLVAHPIFHVSRIRINCILYFVDRASLYNLVNKSS